MSDVASVNWKVAGRAGEGIDVTGVMFGKVCLRHGMNVFTYREYPSLIRGGHNTHQVHASFDPQTCQRKHIDLLIALNEEGISFHLDEIGPDSVVLCEASQDKYDPAKYAKTGATFYDVPMTNIAREATGHFLAQNVVALGMSAYILNLDLEVLRSVVTDQFKEKGEKVIAPNIQAMEKGYEYAKANCKQIKPAITKQPNTQMLLTGNHAVSLGAIAGGLQYFAAYPMTPTSDVLHTLAAMQSHFPIVVKHVEDEIAAVNHAIGASYAGVRAMTASATGGYALMVEATSLAAVAETPLVIIVGQRPGPATGLPTWTCQSDLQFILYAGHGEIPRVVFTPGSVQEHYELTQKAFYLAEKYHLLVYVLSDKFALESYASMPTPDAEVYNERYSFAPRTLPEDDSYRRFEVTPEGYSPRSIPGQPHGLNITNSYEHDEFGYATESAELTKAMNEKRHRKVMNVAKELPAPQLIGPKKADVTLVSWGSTVLVTEEVIRQVNADTQFGFTVNAIHLNCAWPFPVEGFTELAEQANKLVMIEANTTGQMQKHIRQETGITFEHWIRRYDGRPFYVEEVIAELQRIMKV